MRYIILWKMLSWNIWLRNKVAGKAVDKNGDEHDLKIKYAFVFRNIPVLEVAGKAVDNNGNGQGEDEDAAESAQAADQLAREGGRGELPVAGEQLVSCLTRLIITTQTK